MRINTPSFLSRKTSPRLLWLQRKVLKPKSLIFAMMMRSNQLVLVLTFDILFCFYPRDSDNVFLTISARAIDKALTIVAIVDDPESAEKLLAAGANKIIDPYEICGRKTHDMLAKPDITNILDHTVFGRHDLHIAQIEIPAGSCLENTTTSELKLDEKHNLILIGVVDKESGEALHFAIGENEYTLNAGDVLVVLGPSREIRAFKEEVETV